jgi:ATP-dependent RNA helicase HelY
MAVNLLRQHDVQQAETLLGASFAQFQADRETAGLGRRLVEAEEGIRGYAPHLQCEAGDWDAYWRLRRDLSRREKRRRKDRRHDAAAAGRDGIAGLQPGDVLALPAIGRRGLAAVVGIHVTKKGIPLAQVVADDRTLTKIGPRELDGAPVVVDRVRLPHAGNPRQRDYRDAVATLLEAVDASEEATPTPEVATADDAVIDRLRREIRAHPCHHCPDRADHERWQYRADTLIDDAAKLRRRIERRTGSLVRQLHRIIAVLQRLGYLDEAPAPTDEGLRLAGIYSDVDLLVAESLRRGILEDLDDAELAGICALFLYEPRGGDMTIDPEIPTPALRRAVADVLALADELRTVEEEAGLQPLGDLDGGFVAPAWRWAAGRSLEDALGLLELTGGDFVRNVKQLADLAGQLRDVGGPALRATAGRTVDALRRGIVEA